MSENFVRGFPANHEKECLKLCPVLLLVAIGAWKSGGRGRRKNLLSFVKEFYSVEGGMVKTEFFFEKKEEEGVETCYLYDERLLP